jgi:voltage-gated potassium channel
MKNIFELRVYKALALLGIVTSMGVIGYMNLSNASFIDALYMTVITVTTVGFGEINPPSDSEKIFTIFLILTSISILGYTVSLFSEYLISGQFFSNIKLKKVQKKIDKLEGHSIVCGVGRNGNQAIQKLISYRKKLVVIEKNVDTINKLESEGVLCVKGDATTDEALLKAGIQRAANLITTLPSDADNLFVVLSAHQLNKQCKIISRASKESSYTKLKIAGAENVIMPDKLGGAHMASLVVTPDVIEFVDRLTISGDTTTNLKEISIDELPDKYLNKTILDLDVRKKTGCTVIGFKSPEKEYIINPESSTTLVAGSNLIVLGKPEQITTLRKLFKNE